ncbi:hypothetical protein M405DRAFT_869085 [Rhizopogon salebrosus TDB-379]|nr:hypothetical protein M405DRAFT_869085 [Rhizopogon salebrosus TDB-379]
MPANSDPDTDPYSIFDYDHHHASSEDTEVINFDFDNPAEEDDKSYLLWLMGISMETYSDTYHNK